MRKIITVWLCFMLVVSMSFIAMDTHSFTEDTGAQNDLSDDDWNTINDLIQEAQYHLTRHDPSEGFVGSNSKCGFGMIFNENGVSVSPEAENSWSWDIALSGFGYSGQVSPITAKPQLSVDKNRVECEYSPQLTEWYINDERGIEQGFTIETPPQPRINAPLVIEMALETTLKPKMIDNGEAIAFHDNLGEHILTYKGLKVIDALGQDVSAWLSLSHTSVISIFIDDTSTVYPLIIDPLITTEVKKLTALDGVAEDRFGGSVSVFGDVIVVGAYFDDVGANINQGSAYVFERNTGGSDVWGEVTKLTALDGAAGDLFGGSISIFSDTIVVGARRDDVGANLKQGSAYVFERNTGGPDMWGEVTKLTALDGAAGDLFGGFVSVFGDVIVVGAYEDDVGVNNAQGSAYVFERNTGGADNWGQVTKLTALDGAANDYFGRASVFGDIIVIGAYCDDVDANINQGSAYVFERNTGGPDMWGEVTKLVALDGVAEDRFGGSISIFSDIIVVGASGDDVGANLEQGSAYVFERNTGGADNWGQVTKLTALDGATMAYFGGSISIFSDTIVVGAYADDIGGNLSQGSAYVFERNTGGADNWGETIKLRASDGAAWDRFGGFVSVFGDVIVVGAYGDDVGANVDQGSAYTFVRNGDAWVEISHPVASDGAVDDYFGISVSISGDTVVVGAHCDDVGANSNQGSVYMFERNTGGADNWGQVTKLTASDGAVGDYFGISVCISGDTVVVGAYMDNIGANDSQGSVYVFERNIGGADNWDAVTKLTASDGAAGDWFGISVCISGDTVVVGAYMDDVGVNSEGSAYVFERNTGGADNWGQVTKLTASDGVGMDYFGRSVSISGDTVVVGADSDGVGANADQGSAYVFERNTGGADNWGQVTKLTASDGGASDRFGISVSISDDTVVVGAGNDDVGANSNQGSAYVFERNTGGADNWGQVTKLTASDGAVDDYFGISVCISGDTVVVGASSDVVGANSNQGSAYVFKLTIGFVIPLDEGWNLISMPLTQTATSIDKVLYSINGKWDYILIYNSMDSDHWKTNATFKPDQLNDLETLNHEIGLWINITESNVNLSIYGDVPTSTIIPLYAGWNLVGYPTLNDSTPIWSAFWGTGADRVQIFDPAEPYLIKEIDPSYVMQPGEGYWVHVPADTVWVVDW
ncbi:MAG: FG-GAP repeat protein [Thermoplasmata archaeon]|nr:FG-GAP repeat protein [Thermoplasmata archaeon]